MLGRGRRVLKLRPSDYLQALSLLLRLVLPYRPDYIGQEYLSVRTISVKLGRNKGVYYHPVFPIDKEGMGVFFSIPESWLLLLAIHNIAS
jgi:hypothetical protein